MITQYSKHGCLTVLDLGEEYINSGKYLSAKEKYDSLCKEMQPAITERQKLIDGNPALYEKCKQRVIDEENSEFYHALVGLNMRLYPYRLKLEKLERELKTHYKCRCKCGKTHYYNEETVVSNPKYCFYPVPISTRQTYSNKAKNATYRKEQQYANIECVVLCDRSDCTPSTRYCDYYNSYKTKQLKKAEDNRLATIAELPRVAAKNYDIDYTGVFYESLEVLECTNEAMEIIPEAHFTQQHRKIYTPVIVYKQYRCRCYLCGKEQLVTCDKFGIFPPTEYGYTAYNGYWSAVKCDCHQISSFQWIVNKLLIENGIPYRVEVSFPGLYGVSGTNQLRFDFAVYNDRGSITCLIECQGEQHYEPVTEFGGNRQYDIQVRNDAIKRSYAKEHNIQLIEIPYTCKRKEKIENILVENHILLLND